MSRTFVSTFRCVAFPAILLALALGTVGCGEELETANRTLRKRLDDANANNMRLQAERDASEAELAAQRLVVLERDTRIAALQGQIDKKDVEFLELSRLYQELLNAPRPAPKIIVGPALPQELNAALKAFAQANPDLAEFDEKNGMVKLKSDLTFAPGSSVVKAATAGDLAKLVQILNDPAARAFSVYIAGHTDDMPIRKAATLRKHPTNWYLSAHRAVGVEKVLEKAGLTPARMCAMGFGEYHPIAPNKPGHKGNELNRRVEIWIVPAGQFLTVKGPIMVDVEVEVEDSVEADGMETVEETIKVTPAAPTGDSL